MDNEFGDGFEASAAVFAAVVESAPDGLLIVGDSGKILLANQQAARLLGYERVELLGASVDSLLPEADRSRHRTHRDRFHGDPQTRPMGNDLRLHAQRKDGSLVPVEISLSPLPGDGSDSMVIASIRDVTARLAVEQQLAKSHEMATLLEDRQRVARDLHDTVIQELFATGMNLQAAAATISDPTTLSRVLAAVDEIDVTIKQIRGTIFGLTMPMDGAQSVRSQLLAVAASYRDALGFEPRITFDGLVDIMGATVLDHLLPTLREALSNTARHAKASHVTASVTVTGDEIRLDVVDDGVGIAGVDLGNQPGNGIRNMHDRAVILGGSCSLSAAGDGGTALSWRVPHPASTRD